MLLAEALKDRATLEGEIRELKSRIADVAVHPDDEPATEPAKDLLEALLTKITAAAELTGRINRANNAVSVSFEGRKYTLMGAVLARDELKRKAEAVRSILAEVERAFGGHDYGYGRRRGKDEVKLMSDLPVGYLRTMAEGFSARLNALDMEIQKVNFTATLAD
jgi:hypothetical protein